jgi:glutamate/tyrosine decarboxylase-like PLP-dependent enzyme
MRELLEDVASRAARYLEHIGQRRVGPAQDAVQSLDRFRESMPAGPTEPADVIRMLDELGSPATVGMAGPRFFGLVIGGSVPAAVGANWLATAWDQNAGLFASAPICAVLEEVALAWLFEILSLPSGCAGAFVTGATLANFTALAAARHAVLKRVGWDVESQGLFGAPAIQVAVSEEVHASLIKALGMLGLGRDRVLRVPVDGQGACSPTEFQS